MNDIILINFLTIISSLNESLKKLSIVITKEQCFTKSETKCDIYTRHNGFPEFSFGIEVDIAKPINDDLHSAGMSFTIFKKNDDWNLTGEIGWSSYKLGFDEADSINKTYKEIDLLLADLRPQFIYLKEKYEALLQAYHQKTFKPN